MSRSHLFLISLVFIFSASMTTRIEADGSPRSIGLHHWVQGNKCYRSEDWDCALFSWSVALSTAEFIEWQEPRNTFNGMYALAHVAILKSKNCTSSSSQTEIENVERVISNAADELSNLGRLTLSPADLLAFVTPSLDVCGILICKAADDDECVEERLQSLDVSRIEALDFLGLLPGKLATSDAVVELFRALPGSE